MLQCVCIQNVHQRLRISDGSWSIFITMGIPSGEPHKRNLTKIYVFGEICLNIFIFSLQMRLLLMKRKNI